MDKEYTFELEVYSSKSCRYFKGVRAPRDVIASLKQSLLFIKYQEGTLNSLVL